MNHKEQRDYRAFTHDMLVDAMHEFYEWEKTVDMVMSDDDRLIWMQGFIWANAKSKGETV